MLIRRKKQDNGMFKWKNNENDMPREKTRGKTPQKHTAK